MRRRAVILAAVALAAATLPLAAARSAGPATTSRSLQSVWMDSPAAGFGTVMTETSVGSNATCHDAVGRTTDGAHSFGDLVPVLSWNCAARGFSSQLVFDAHGDGFLYGPQLYATHDGGHAWRRVAAPGEVLAVAPQGRSIWMVIGRCPASTAGTPRRCPLALETSRDGGVRWTLNQTLPATATVSSALTAGFLQGQGYLVRPSARLGLVLSDPVIDAAGRPNAAPLWVTTDGGHTWTHRAIGCGMDAFTSMVTVTPSAWFAICAGQPSAGFQPKTVLRSLDGGVHWRIVSRCDLTAAHGCASPIDEGYLGVLAATSARVLYESGTRSNLNVSRDGGATWVATLVRLNEIGDGVSQLWTFGPRRALALSAPVDLVASTDDGGATWTIWHARLT